METNNQKCPYCYSKLKKSELNCPKCQEKIFIKETCIKSGKFSIFLIYSCIWISALFLFWLILYFTRDLQDPHIIFLPMSFTAIIILSLFFCFCLANKSKSYFKISREKIQIITRDFNPVFIELLWKEINRIEIVKEKYSAYSKYEGFIIVFGYKLKFCLSEGEKSFRLKCLHFYQEKKIEKIINLIKEFSVYLKKEINELEDLENVKPWRDLCPNEKLN